MPSHATVTRLRPQWQSCQMPIAVVTGASRGLGAALLEDLRVRGYEVAGCATGATDPHLSQVDVADASAVDRFASVVFAGSGPIDLWINNAAVIGPIGPLGKQSGPDADAWRRCVEVNVLGVVNGARSFLAHRSERATLVNIASRAATFPAPGIAAYSATKAAVVALTIAVAEEEGGSGLSAHVVLPPSVDTDMQNTLLTSDPADFPHVVHSLERKRKGEVLPATEASRIILEAILDQDNRGNVVLDLTG